MKPTGMPFAQLTLDPARAYHRALFAPDSEPTSPC